MKPLVIFSLLSSIAFYNAHATHNSNTKDKDLNYQLFLGTTMKFPFHNSTHLFDRGSFSPVLGFYKILSETWSTGLEFSQNNFVQKTRHRSRLASIAISHFTHYRHRLSFPTYLNIGYTVGMIKPTEKYSTLKKHFIYTSGHVEFFLNIIFYV